MLFRRKDEADENEDLDETEVQDAGDLAPDIPDFVVIVSDVSNDGWHMAALIGDSANPDYFVRAVTVAWPFVIARPVPSTRMSHKPVHPDLLSPSGTVPARRLVVNWRWIAAEGSVAQLRFYARRDTPLLFRDSCAVRVRVTLKETAWPGRRVVVRLKSNRITWNPPPPDAPASPPESVQPP